MINLFPKPYIITYIKSTLYHNYASLRKYNFTFATVLHSMYCQPIGRRNTTFLLYYIPLSRHQMYHSVTFIFMNKTVNSHLPLTLDLAGSPSAVSYTHLSPRMNFNNNPQLSSKSVLRAPGMQETYRRQTEDSW